MTNQSAKTVRGWEQGTRELLLAKLHVNGLGLAANEAGREVLLGLRESVPEKSPEVWRKIAPNVSEALETSRRIEELGYLRALTPGEVKYTPPEKRDPG